VARVGGTVLQDLSLINAFAAEMPAAAVAELAQMPGVRWISLDAPMFGSACDECINTANLKNAFIQTIGADRLWNEAPYLQGQRVTVAVVDSGVKHRDIGNRLLASYSSKSIESSTDQYGHGTHIAGTIGSDGQSSKGAYIGVAPKVNLVSVKVSDDKGNSRMSDVVAGLQWVYNNRAKYNIRVVNLSLNSAADESYHTSPLDAAMEILWFNRIVVVVSAGNRTATRNPVLFAPANDPFVITVGASDDQGTPNRADDLLASYSAFGTTKAGFAKPDLVAPGTNVVSMLASNGTQLAKEHRDHVINGGYMRMSGTSMASAITAGAAALLIQSKPSLTPDQVKAQLMAAASPLNGSGARYLNIYAAVHSPTPTVLPNAGIQISHLLQTGSHPVEWPTWDSVNWDSVNWDSVNWDSVNWDSVNWDSDYWGN
jgi:serine protease AprX